MLELLELTIYDTHHLFVLFHRLV